MRRYIVPLVIVLALIAAAVFYWQRREAALNETPEIIRQAQVERGQVAATVNAIGAIEPEAEVSLTFGLGGTITAVNVVRGQTVTAGTVLATLDTAELELAVQQAADALQIQELTREQRLNSGPSPATLAAAEADIAAAQANLVVAQANVASAAAGVAQAQAGRARLLEGAAAADIAAVEAEITSLQIERDRVQESYDELLEAGIGGPPEEGLRNQLTILNQQLRTAELRLASLQAGPSAADFQQADASIAAAQASQQAAEGNVQVAEANIARAEAALARLMEPPTADEIAILAAQIQSARTNLALAELRLSQAQIVAPIDGRVANVLINSGEQAAPGAPAVILVVEDAFHIDVNVDEIDIAQVAVGQLVDITLDALPDARVPGVIAEIAPTAGSTGGGVVAYLVTINLSESSDVTLRPGMSANAAIVVDEVDDVLIVPNWAIRLDRETGAAYVNRLAADGTIEEVTITTGLRNEQFSEVTSGLSAGDDVVVTNERETFSVFGG